MYLKDSDDNHLESNTFRDRTARVTGDAKGNAFVNNSFVGATLQFRVYEASPNRIPANNSVVGGSMTSGATCLRFTSSSGNVVSDVLLSGCGTQILSEGTPAHPSSNTIVGMTLTPSKVSVDVDSTLSVGWWLDAAVESSGGAPLAGARIRALDLLGDSVFDLVTDASGDVPNQVLLQYVRTGSVTLPRTPHVLTTTKDGSTDVRTVSGHPAISTSPWSCLALSARHPAGRSAGRRHGSSGGGTDPPGGRGDFFDDFNRGDSSVPGMGWLTVQGGLGVADGELRSDASMKGSAPGGAAIAERDVTRARRRSLPLPDNNTSPRFGIVLRIPRARRATTSSIALIGGTSLVRIAKVENGVERVLASANVANPARGTFFHLRGEATPTGLSLELDGVRKLSVSESGFATGSPGVLVGVASGRAAPPHRQLQRVRPVAPRSCPRPPARSSSSVGLTLHRLGRLGVAGKLASASCTTTASVTPRSGRASAPSAFEGQLGYLVRHGYTVLSLSEADRPARLTIRRVAPGQERGRSRSTTGSRTTTTNALPILTRLKVPATDLPDGWLHRHGPAADTDAHRLHAPPARLARGEGDAGPGHRVRIPYDHASDAVPGSSGMSGGGRSASPSECSRTSWALNVPFFCYPRGDVNEAVRRVVRDEGYRAACSTLPGLKSRRIDLFGLRRTYISRHDSPPEFAKKMAGAYDLLQQALVVWRRLRPLTAAWAIRPSADAEKLSATYDFGSFFLWPEQGRDVAIRGHVPAPMPAQKLSAVAWPPAPG